MGVPITTHQWLRPLYNALNGRSASPTGVAYTQLGSATGLLGVYGATGGRQISTGTNSIGAATGLGNSGGLWFNGGSGAYYTQNDVVLALKVMGVIKP